METILEGVCENFCPSSQKNILRSGTDIGWEDLAHKVFSRTMPLTKYGHIRSMMSHWNDGDIIDLRWLHGHIWSMTPSYCPPLLPYGYNHLCSSEKGFWRVSKGMCAHPAKRTFVRSVSDIGWDLTHKVFSKTSHCLNMVILGQWCHHHACPFVTRGVNSLIAANWAAAYYNGSFPLVQAKP